MILLITSFTVIGLALAWSEVLPDLPEKFNRKPLNCWKCVAWWVGVGAAIGCAYIGIFSPLMGMSFPGINYLIVWLIHRIDDRYF